MKAPKSNLCRAVPFTQRADTVGGDGFTLAGCAAVFDTPTLIDSWEGTFNEQMAHGAFKKTLKERKPVIQFDHGRDTATGSVPIAAPPDASEDDEGLQIESRMHDNARVEPIRQAIASGAINGMSIRFRVTRDKWDPAEPDECPPGVIPMRTIQEVELYECGPVVFPAYVTTSVGVRSMLAELSDADRRRFLDELRTIVLPADAAPSGTSATQQHTDAGQEATSGATPGERDAFFRSQLLTRKKTTP